MIPWTSGTTQPLDCVFRPTVFQLRLEYVSGTERPVNGLGPHVLFVPAYSDDSPWNGDIPTDTDPFAYRFDLQSMVLPVAGSLYITGGSGANYKVRIAKRLWQGPMPGRQGVTMRTIDAAYALPRGCRAIKSSSAQVATITYAAENLVVDLPAGEWVELGSVGEGTILPVATIPLLSTDIVL